MTTKATDCNTGNIKQSIRAPNQQPQEQAQQKRRYPKEAREARRDDNKQWATA